jgi:hypothetical protein
MLGIFGAVTEKKERQAAAEYLSSWLNTIKKNNLLNIKSLAAASTKNTAIKPHIEKLTGYFKEANNLIDQELGRVHSLKRSLNIKSKE